MKLGNAILCGQGGSSPPTVNQAYGYQLLSDQTVTGSAVTTVSFTGLNVGVGDELLLVSEVYNPTSGYISCNIYCNNNTTQTNYYSQHLSTDSTTVTSGRYNFPLVTEASLTNKAFSNTKIKLTNNGYFTYQSMVTRSFSGSSVRTEDWYGTSTFTATSIASLAITASSASAIGIGSRFWLYKINGKEAKTWVTS